MNVCAHFILALCGDGNCGCYKTTGNGSFCAAEMGAACADCRKDKDCETLGFPAGSACVLANGKFCPACVAGTMCVPPCPALG